MMSTFTSNNNVVVSFSMKVNLYSHTHPTRKVPAGRTIKNNCSSILIIDFFFLIIFKIISMDSYDKVYFKSTIRPVVHLYDS